MHIRNVTTHNNEGSACIKRDVDEEGWGGARGWGMAGGVGDGQRMVREGGWGRYEVGSRGAGKGDQVFKTWRRH